MTFLRWTLILSVALSVCTNANIPDYYDGPNGSPVRQSIEGVAGDSIDPLGGQLSIVHTDIALPGNGGLDIAVNRNYSSHNVYAQYNVLNGSSFTGRGWDIHFGRVWTDRVLTPQYCKSTMVSTSQNPVLQLPDGSKRLLINSLGYSLIEDPDNKSDISLITKDFWSAQCIDLPYTENGDEYQFGGLEVRSPDGTRYTFNRYDQVRQVDVNGDAPRKAYLLTQITDVHDNWIRIDYVPHAESSFAQYQQVTSSDGRQLNFEYSQVGVGGTSHTLLTKIYSDQQVVTYSYDHPQGLSGQFPVLSEVLRADGSRWAFDYYDTGDEKHLLQSMTNPLGAKTEYTYQTVYFESPIHLPTLAIKSKKISAVDIVAAEWFYDYRPGVTDVTTITGPDSIQTYEHFGIRAASFGSVWRIGTLLKKSIYSSAQNLQLDNAIQTELYEWIPNTISSQNEHRPSRSVADDETQAPFLKKKTIIRDETQYITEYHDYFSLGVPRAIIETGNQPVESMFLSPEDQNGSRYEKSTTFTYIYNLGEWIINMNTGDTVSPVSNVTGDNQYTNVRQYFYSNGLVEGELVYGTPRGYTYDAQGNLTKDLRANRKLTLYSDYYRGVARETSIARTDISTLQSVDERGNITAMEDSLGRITHYEYDTLNRITQIEPPINNKISINYVGYGKERVLRRGLMTDRRVFDSLGRQIRREVTGEEPIYNYKEYDALGRIVFESYPIAGRFLGDNRLPIKQGMHYRYDALGRLVEKRETSGSVQKWRFLPNNIVEYTDPKGIKTRSYYRSFGDPDDKQLVKIEQPDNVNTTIERNLIGQPIAIKKGNVVRNYYYDQFQYLIKETHPDLGEITYERDRSGNMTKKRINGLPISYTYDSADRLIGVDYAEKNFRDYFKYDANDNLIYSFRRGYDDRIEWNYEYDKNDNLISEIMSVDSVDQDFLVNYEYDGQDSLAAIVYPSNLRVDYAPDAYSRPTKVGDFVGSIQYHPNGALKEWLLGNDVRQTASLNSRLLPERITTHTSQGSLDLFYQYDLNNNVRSLTSSSHSDFNVSMTYDRNDRLASAQGVWGQSEYQYDEVDNIKQHILNNRTTKYHYTDNLLMSTDLDGVVSREFTYDRYRNVNANGKYQFSYDGAGNLRKTLDENTLFYYDANNRRVLELKGNKANYTVYNNSGKLLYEQDAQILDVRHSRDYIYLGNKLIARHDTVVKAPVVTLLIPEEQHVFVEGGVIEFEASAIDDIDGDISDSIKWYANGRYHNPDDAELLGEGSRLEANLTPGTYKITAYASNSKKVETKYHFLIGVMPVDNQYPVLSVSNPVDQGYYSIFSVFNFEAQAIDPDQGDITHNIEWSSDVDGYLGRGTDLEVSGLSLGPHKITAVIYDRYLAADSKTLTITVGENGSDFDDFLVADDGDNIIRTGAGNDTVEAGGGNDTIIIGSDLGRFNGGKGDDVFHIESQYGFLVIDAGHYEEDGVNTLILPKGVSPKDVTLNRVANDWRDADFDLTIRVQNTTHNLIIEIYKQFATTYAGFSRPGSTCLHLADDGFSTNAIDEIHFEDGTVWNKQAIREMVIIPSVDDDLIAGYYGQENTLYGEDGSDQLYGGNLNDTLYGGNGNDGYYEEQWSEEGLWVIGRFGLFGGNGDDTLYGGAGDDMLVGGFSSTDDYLFRLNWHNDTTRHWWGRWHCTPEPTEPDNDQLYGEEGNDYLYGGLGDDLIVGGPGNDLLIGGPGQDTFVFSASDGQDRLTNRKAFQRGGNNTSPPFVDQNHLILDNTLVGDIVFYPNNIDLHIEFGNSAQSIVVEHHFTCPNTSSLITLPNGNQLTHQALIDLLGGVSVSGVTNPHQACYEFPSGAEYRISLDNLPQLEVSQPLEASQYSSTENIALSAIANDIEDGDMSASIQWHSSLQGELGQGAQLSVMLSEGVHIITASVTDSLGQDVTHSVSITVEPPVNLSPTLTIVSFPADNIAEQGQLLELAAQAQDPEQGDLSQAIHWHSSLQGELGNGGQIAPNLQVGLHTITVSVEDDNGARAEQTLSLDVQLLQEPIVADAGSDQVLPPGSTVTLDGLASVAHSGQIQRYEWRLVEGSIALIWDNPNQAVTSFTPPQRSDLKELVFELTVISDQGHTATDQVTITLLPVPNTNPWSALVASLEQLLDNTPGLAPAFVAAVEYQITLLRAL